MLSIWKDSVKDHSQQYPALEDNIKTDVLIIGGGMAGIMTAYKLNKSGVSCTVVEAKTIGSGITQNTTAKITAQHGLIYSDLIRRFGLEKAKLYLELNSNAIDEYRKLSELYACDLEEKTAYVYSTDDRNRLEKEAAAYKRLGLPDKVIDSLPLPISIAGSIAMEKQAQFNPLKLLFALADGLKIYENTFVQKVDGSAAVTKKGTIQAKHIILATHYPLINIPGLYFMKLYQHRSYVIALENAPLIDGMFLDEKENGLSFRTYQDLLLIGGGDHRTGKNGGGYEELRAFAAKAYPNSKERYHWATQDCMSLDSVPYVGRHSSGKGKFYVATGFNKWGMTGSMAAANILHDMIVEGKSRYAGLYSPRRSMFTVQLGKNILSAAGNLLCPGSPRCAHMGCKLRWNSLEKTWDCPCHGSRFQNHGDLIDNPAKKGIRL